MRFKSIRDTVKKYYNEKLDSYGPTAKGVDWNTHESQELRFKQLLKIINHDEYFSINDFGCGYGGLLQFLIDREYHFQYCGYDISEKMIDTARSIYTQNKCCSFCNDESLLSQADYTVASGIFNVKLQTHESEWIEYILFTLEKMNKISIKGFSFNILTTNSDPELRSPDLYYCDPCFMFNYCVKKYSRHVALLHDYGLYEFTILVKKR